VSLPHGDACLRAFAYQSTAASARRKVHPPHPLALCKPSRAPAEPPLYTFEVHLELTQCLAIDKEKNFPLGLGSGYKVMLNVAKQQAEGAAATLGLYVALVCPDLMDQLPPPAEDETVNILGPFVALRVSAGGETASRHYVYNEFSFAWGYPDFFGKSWEEVVHGGSAYFPEGRMTIKVEVQLLSNKHAAAVMPAWARP
jgi:hypothetical protein